MILRPLALLLRVGAAVVAATPTGRALQQLAACQCEHCMRLGAQNTVSDCEAHGLDCACLLDCKCKHCVVAQHKSRADCESLGLDCSCYTDDEPGGDGKACADLNDRIAAVNDTCCDEASEDCSSGQPATCNLGCAHVLLPFFDDCAEALGPIIAGLFNDVVVLCHQAKDCDGRHCGEDCRGKWGGTSVRDTCGVCDGDGSSCARFPRFAVTSGPCTTATPTGWGNCFRSPNYPARTADDGRWRAAAKYGPSEDCAIAVSGVGFVRATTFDTEDYVDSDQYSDYVSIGGVHYSGGGGTLATTGVVVSASVAVAWHTGRPVAPPGCVDDDATTQAAFLGQNTDGSGFTCAEIADWGCDDFPPIADWGWCGCSCPTARMVADAPERISGVEVCSVPCDAVACGQHGSCSANGASCVCADGWSGDLCTVCPGFACPDRICDRVSSILLLP
jgi:hypothetical protein